MSKIIIKYNDEWYDVTNFSHPGEGIKNIYLKDFHLKKIDEELHNEHMTNEPYEYLEEAKKKGIEIPGSSYEGIIYIGKDLPQKD